MNKYIMIMSTFDSMEELEKVSNILLEKRLVSCTQVSTIKSTYYWNEKLVTSDEYLLRMKTKKELYSDVETIILANHSYEVPQIVAYDISMGYTEYLKWIDKETKQR